MTETYLLPVTSRGRMRLSPRLRERHLTPQTENGTCLTQAVGKRVFVWVFSDRQDIRIALPVGGFATSRAYEQAIHRWGISINRYLADDATGVLLDTTGDKPTVEAEVGVIETAEVPLDA